MYVTSDSCRVYYIAESPNGNAIVKLKSIVCNIVFSDFRAVCIEFIYHFGKNILIFVTRNRAGFDLGLSGSTGFLNLVTFVIADEVVFFFLKRRELRFDCVRSRIA